MNLDDLTVQQLTWLNETCAAYCRRLRRIRDRMVAQNWHSKDQTFNAVCDAMHALSVACSETHRRLERARPQHGGDGLVVKPSRYTAARLERQERERADRERRELGY